MELIAHYRRFFSAVVIVTKNPEWAARPEYLPLLERLAPCLVEVSLAFRDDRARALLEPGAPAVASRLAYLRKKGGKLNSGRADLVDAVESGEVELEEVPVESLPEEMQAMSREEQGAYLRQKTAERKSLRERIATLVDQRDAYVAKETARLEAEGKGDGFDAEVMDSIRKQAVDYGIVY